MANWRDYSGEDEQARGLSLWLAGERETGSQGRETAPIKAPHLKAYVKGWVGGENVNYSSLIISLHKYLD